MMKSSDTMADAQDMSKVVVCECPGSKEKTMEETKTHQPATRAFEAVARVRAEVDKLSDKVVALERNVHGGAKSEDQECVVLIELLMAQLLRLDAIEADGDAKPQRKIEVCLVQSFVDTLDNLRAQNSNMFSNPMASQAKQELLLTGNEQLRLSAP